MEERLQSLKRKRENDYPRVTFTTGARTFDRLLKESTLGALKEGVRKKLGYASDVPLQLTQLRDGKTVDLEDDDDFEAFCAAASSLSVVTVQVMAPADAPQTVPAKMTPLPPTRTSSVESPKRRRKKKKSLAAEDKPEEHVEASEKSVQKRKAPAADPEDKAAEAQQPHAQPPKKRKKKNAASDEPQVDPATAGDKSEKPAAHAAAPTVDKEKESDETAKEPKKRKKAKKAATAADEDAEHAPAVTEPEQEQETNTGGKDGGKGKEQGKKMDNAKEAEREKSKEIGAGKVKEGQNAKDNGQSKSKGKQTQPTKDKKKVAELTEDSEIDVDALMEKYEEKRLAAKKKPVSGVASSAPKQVGPPEKDSDSSSSDSDSADEKPPPTRKACASVIRAAAENPVVNGKPKDAKRKEKAKEVETLGSSNDPALMLAECINAAAAANSTAPRVKAAEVHGKKAKATKKAAAELPSQAERNAIMAQMDEMLAAKRKKAEAPATDQPTTEAAPVVSAAPKKKKAAVQEKEVDAPVVSAPKKSTAIDKPSKAPAKSSALDRLTSTDKAGESSPEEEDTEEAPVVSAAPKISRGPKPAICPYCAAKPAHTKSRCNAVRRGAKPGNMKFLKDLKAEQAESPTPFREAQIKAIEELIKEKEAKPKKEPKNKGGSDEEDVVTGIGATSAMSTKTALLTTATTTTTKPGAQANQNLVTISTSADRLVYTPPADGESVSTAGPTAQQGRQVSTAVPLPSGPLQPPSVSSKPKHTTQTMRNDSASESSESEEDEPRAARKSTFKPKPQSNASTAAASASTAVSSKNAQAPVSKGLAQPQPVHQRSDEEAFPSVSQASSSRTVVPPRLSHASAKPRPHPLSKVISNKSKRTNDSSDEDSEEGNRPAPIQSLPAFLSFDLSNASLADVDLEAVIRGPRVSLSTKHLDLSDEEDEEEEEASVDAEGLVEDEEPKLSRRYSKMFNAATGGSSDEEESDGADSDSNNADEPARRPPRLSLSAAPKPQAVENDEDSGQSSPVDHGSLSFGDVNGMASSVEIDAQGDRAFSQALADDTAVFRLAAQNIEDSTRDSSDRASPDNQLHTEEQEEEDEEEDDEKLVTAKPDRDDRHDSIEHFDSPIKTQAPRSPIGDADVLRSTPRGLRSRMKGKNGKVPESPAPAVPNSSFEKAIQLWNSVQKAKAAKAGSAAKAKVTAPPTPPTEEEPGQESEAGEEAEPEPDAESGPEPEKPVKGKKGKSAKPPSQSQKPVQPPSTRSQKTLAATQPAVSAKPPSRTTRSTKALPATQPAPALTPRTTRAAARRAASVQPEETPAPPPPTQVATHQTQESVHKWETLHAESSSQPDETMNMVDELQSVPEEEDDTEEQEQLFIASETQQSFPYSQWQPQMHSTQRKDRGNRSYSSEEEDEDEVENVVTKSTKSTPEMKKKGTTLAFAKLSQIASQPRTFRASLPTAGVAKPMPDIKKRRETMMADLYGVTADEPSDESGSDSGPGSGDEAEAAPKSHIPRGRRAGLRSGA